MKQGCVLALYEFRGKQAYIYKTNALKEIMGASKMIAEGFQRFLLDGTIKQPGKNETIAWNKLLEEWNYTETGVVVYEGGGNLFVLFRDDEACIDKNREFTCRLMEETYGLKALCAFVPATGNFRKDRAALYEKAREIENLEMVTAPTNVLPFVLVDRKTSLPIAERKMENRKMREYSKETSAKRIAYEKMHKNEGESKFLEDYITEKGEESLLAIVYIDGNNMGQKVKAQLDKDSDDSYESCIRSLKTYSEEINQIYVIDGLKAVDECLAKLKAEDLDENQERKNRIYQYRKIIAAGDEVNIICNARVAYAAANAYLQSLPKTYSSCAGIAVFHDHAPYAIAYQIAEQCCEAAKEWLRDAVTEGKMNEGEYSLMDFHYCDAGINNSLKLIRENEKQIEISRPWFVSSEQPVTYGISIRDVKEKVEELRKLGRSNIKVLAEYAVTSPSSLKRELNRIKAHLNAPLQIHLGEESGEAGKKEQRILYDVVSMYDIWFAKTGDQ